jgi:hypothetical protein
MVTIKEIKCNQCGSTKCYISYTGIIPKEVYQKDEYGNTKQEYNQFWFNKKLLVTNLIDTPLEIGDNVLDTLKNCKLDEVHTSCSKCEDETFATIKLSDGRTIEDEWELIRLLIGE